MLLNLAEFLKKKNFKETYTKLYKFNIHVYISIGDGRIVQFSEISFLIELLNLAKYEIKKF